MQTYCLGTHHIRKNLSSHAETSKLGESVWLLSYADRHCLEVLVGVHELFMKGWIREITNITAWNQAHSSSGFGGAEVVCWPLIPKFAG
jgi:hypothetical protein